MFQSIVPNPKNVMKAYTISKIKTAYPINVPKHQYQGHYGAQGKYYGQFASKINPFKGGVKNA
jgi:hypothetical protein